MTPFTVIEGQGVGLARANVDTDQIIPARFLRKPRSAGYQHFLFHDLRREDAAFPLDDARLAGAAPVLLAAGANFGCGSSREGAVYALVDAGIRCVAAPSFGDIFAGNAAKNGLLTLTLPEAAMAALHRQLPGAVVVDLSAQSLVLPDGGELRFDIDPFRKRRLLQGLDDIGLTLEHQDAIRAFQERDRIERPWGSPA
jgi:3-isopropylmalate/(R)-2-methylmalate dehydratase small subunit